MPTSIDRSGHLGDLDELRTLQHIIIGSKTQPAILVQFLYNIIHVTVQSVMIYTDLLYS